MSEWRYLPKRRVRHAIEVLSGHEVTSLAYCGLDVGRGEAWHGTGSQEEYEQCAALRPCRKCVQRGAK